MEIKVESYYQKFLQDSVKKIEEENRKRKAEEEEEKRRKEEEERAIQANLEEAINYAKNYLTEDQEYYVNTINSDNYSTLQKLAFKKAFEDGDIDGAKSYIDSINKDKELLAKQTNKQDLARIETTSNLLRDLHKDNYPAQIGIGMAEAVQKFFNLNENRIDGGGWFQGEQKRKDKADHASYLALQNKYEQPIKEFYTKEIDNKITALGYNPDENIKLQQLRQWDMNVNNPYRTEEEKREWKDNREDRRAAYTAAKVLYKAKKDLNHYLDNQKFDWFGDFGYSFGNEMVQVLTLGIDDAKNQLYKAKLESKMREGGYESLSDNEKAVVDAYSVLDDVNQTVATNKGLGDALGQLTANSVGFMAQMGLANKVVGGTLKATGSAIAKNTEKQSIKNTIEFLEKTSSKEAAKQYITKGGKVASYSAYAANRGAYWTTVGALAAPLQPMTWSAAGEMYSGAWTTIRGKDGEVDRIITDQKSANDFITTELESIYTLSNYAEKIVEQMQTAAGAEATASDFEVNNEIYDIMFSDKYADLRKNAFGDDLTKTFNELGYGSKSLALLYRLVEENILEHQANIELIGDPNNPENPYYDVSFGKSYGKGYIDQVYENWSETLVGSTFDEAVHGAKALFKIGKKAEVNAAKSGFHPISQLIRGGKDIGNKLPSFKGVINSLPGEATEEYVRNFMYNPLGTEQEWKDQLKENTTADFALQTVLSTALISAGGAVFNKALQITNGTNSVYNQIMAINNATERLGALAEAFKNGDISEKDFNNSILNLLNPTKRNRASLQAVLSDLQKLEASGRNVSQAKKLMESIGLLSYITNSQAGQENSILENIKKGLEREATAQGLSSIEELKSYKNFYSTMLNTSSWIKKINKLKEEGKFVSDKHEDDVRQLLYQKKLYDILGANYADSIKESLKATEHGSTLSDEQLDSVVAKIIAAKDSEEFDQTLEPFNLKNKEKKNFETFKAIESVIGDRQNKLTEQFNLRMDLGNEKSIKDLKDFYQVEEKDAKNSAAETRQSIAEEIPTITDARENTEIKDKKERRSLKKATTEVPIGGLIEYNGKVKRKTKTGSLSNNVGEISNGEFVYRYKKDKQGNFIRDVEEIHLSTEDQAALNNTNVEEIAQQSNLSAEELARRSYEEDMYDNFYAPILDDEEISEAEKEVLKRMYLPYIKNNRLSFEEVVHLPGTSLNKAQYKYLREEILKDNDIDQFTKEKWTRLDNNKMNSVLNSFVKSALQAVAEEKQDRVNDKNQDAAEKIKKAVQQGSAVKDVGLMKINIVPQAIPQDLAGSPITLSIDKNWNDGTKVVTVGNKRWNFLELLSKIGINYTKFENLTFEEIKEKVEKGEITEKEFVKFMGIVPLQGDTQKGTLTNVFPSPNDINYNEKFLLVNGIVRHCFEIIKGLQRKGLNVSGLYDSLNDFRNNVEISGDVEPAIKILATALKESDIDISEIISGLRNVARNTANNIRRIRTQVAKTGTYTLTINEVAMIAPEMEEKEKPFSEIKDSELRFCCYQKAQDGLVDLQTKEKLYPEQILSYKDVMIKVVEGKGFALVKTGRKVTVSKNDTNGKPVAKEVDEYYVLYTDTRIQYNDVDKPQQIGLVKSMVNTLVFIKELCNHDFSSGFFRTEFNGKTVVVTPQNANTVFQKLFDILEFGNAASERKKENLLGYVNKISQTLVPEGYGDSKQIMSKLGPAYYTRISFKTLGNEHLIVPIINVDENGNVDSQLSEPLTVRDFRLQVLGTKAKIVDGKVSITPTLILSDNSKPVQQEETPTPPTQDIVNESEEKQEEDEEQEGQEGQEEQNSEEEESKENKDKEDEEESIEEEEEELIEPKDVIDENANLRSYQGIVSYLHHDVFSRMALVDKFKITDIYKEAQKSLDKLIKSLPIGSNVRSFLEANRRDILGIAPGSRYVGSLRQIVDEFFDIRKSLTDDYTAEVLDYEYEDDGSKNFETIYGTQSFEKDINVNLSKRTKMLLSSVPKTTIDENGNIINVKKEGLKTFENYNDILFALQEAISNSSDHTIESAIRYMEEKVKNATTGLYIEDNNKNEVHLENGYEIFKNAVIVLKKLVEDSHKGDSIQNKLKREIEYMLNQNQVTMSFVYAITNTRVTFDEFTGEPTKKETKNISVQDANRRRAVEIKKDKIRLNFRNLLKFDEDLQSYVYDIDKLRELKSLIQKFKTTYQTGDVKRSVDNAGIVYKEAFNDLKRIFEILGIDINDNTILDLFKHTEKGKGLLEIKNVNKGISRGNYGDIIRYLSNLIGDDGQITEILNAEDNNIKFLVGYTGGDFCTWRKYNTETKSIDKNTLHRPILAYNGKGNSGISLVLDILERDDKYTFTPIPNIYINKKRISAFEQKRFINRQMDLIKEGLKQGLEDVPENSRASKLIENLKRTPFAKYSFLLNIIERHRDHIDKIGIEWSSLESLVLKGKEAVNDNTSLVQVSDKDKITAFIGYFTDGFSGTPLFTDNGYEYHVTRFTFPALSDASVLPILKSLAINFSHDELRLSKDGNTFNSGSIKELLYEKLVKGELLRIISYYAAKARTNVVGLDNGSKLFTLIPALNAVRKSNDDGSSFSITDLIKESIEQGNTTEQTLDIIQNAFGDIIKDTTSRVVINQAEDLYKDLVVNGIIQETGDNGLKLLGQLDSNFLNRYKKDKESGELNRREKVHDLCLSYTINSMLAQSDIYKLFVGDLACYNTDKLPKFMTGDVTEIDSKGLIDFYINNYVNSEKAELYKEALDNDDVFSNLKTKEKREVIKLRRLQNINSEEYEKALEIAYGFFIEEVLQKNLNKRLKGLISPGNVLSEASLANSFKETYQIMLEDVNSVSGSIDFYYKIFYKNSDKLSKLEKKDIEEKINLLKNYEEKDSLTEEEKIKFKTTKKELIQKLPDIADYFDIADTDGQEYTTWKNHLQQLLLRGQISDAEYDQITSKLKSQTELNEVNSSNRLSPTELRLALMQPTKPVHFGMYFKEVGEDTENYLSQNMVFVKSSSFPLIPQLTLGFEDIDKLRIVMEKLQTEDRTVRVSYNTGNKVGGLSSAMTFDQVIELADDSDLETKLSNTMVVLDQANYSIQQDKPFDTFENLDEGLRDEIPRSTQMEKSILANGISKIKEKIFPAKKFSLQTLKVLGLVDENMTKEEFKGSNLMISGQDLYNIYDYLYQKEQDILKKKLLAKLNIADFRDVDSAIFKKSIQRLLTQRLTNSQDIEGIELYHKFDIIEDGKLKHYELDDKQWENLSEEVREKVSNYSYDFNINPWVLPNVKKFESVLNNIIADASIRLKFPGSHGIVASQKGFKTNLVGQDEYKGDVIFADDFDGELKAVRDVDGKLKAAQVFVANKFRKFNPKTNKYELIDLRQYIIIKDGKTYLDPERVPEEVREMFSLRIPVSLHQSGMRIEIAGFLPTECGDLMIVPKDSVTQMGEDFDIDVRYYYQANITETPEVRDENGNITEKTKLQLVEPIDNNEPISEQIRKNYFDYLKTVDDRIIDKTDPWYQEYGLDYLMQHAILVSEDKQYKEKHLDDLKKAGATDETIKNIEKLASLIRNSKYKTDLQKYVQQLKKEEIEYQCIENDLMGIYKSVYASENPLVQQKITKVLSTAFLEDTVNVLDSISGRKNYANSTPLSTLKQIDLLNKGNTGKVGIGVWSALEVFISLLQQCQNPVKFNSDWHLGNFHWDGTIGGYYNEETYSYECLKPKNAKKGFKNRTIADIIVEYQNSATDNIKKQIMARRNENEYTFPVYEMFALTGMDKDGFAVDGVELSYPSIFMTQPIIKRYVELCAQNDSLTTQNRIKDEELKKVLRDEFMTKTWKDKKGRVHRDMAKMEDLTGETLFENLQRPNNLVQQTVLSVFLNFKNKFNELRPYITKLNLEQKGLGISFFDTIDKYNFILSDATSTNNDTVTGLNQLVGEKFYVRSNNVTEFNEENQEPALPGPETKINIYAGTNENADLSNFAERPFITTNVGEDPSGPIAGKFNTVEGAFQAQKLAYTDDYTEAEEQDIISKLEKASGSEARRIGKNLHGLNREAWDSISTSLMKSLLTESFKQNPQALQRLLATGNATLTHTQDKGKWGTEFPKLLMEVRDELRNKQDSSQITLSTEKQLKVTESKGSYAQRTEENADWSDITIAFATEFDTLGERLTAQVAGSKDKKYLGDRKPKENVPDKYAPVNILQTGNIDLPMLNNAIEKAKALGKPIKLNIAGNGIYTLEKSGITQEQINNEIQVAIQILLDNGVQIEEIRSGGQSGIDEAGIVAALRLGIPASVHAPKGFKFRGVDNKDISNQAKFLSRFANFGNIISGKTKKDRNVITEETARKMDLVYFGTQNGYDIYIKPNGFYAHKIINSIAEGYNLWKNIFPYDDDKMIRMIYGVLDNSNVDPSTKKGLELKYKILESIQDYVYSTLSCHSFCGNNPDILRRRFFIQDNHNESFAAYIQRLMNRPEYKNSVFFKNLMFNYDLDTKIFTMTYNMNAEGLGEKSQIYEMFREMATSEKELDSWNGMPMSESLLMRYLTQYSFFISGNMNYRKYIPLDVFNTIITTNVNTGNSINLKDELNFKTRDAGLTMTFASYMDQMEDFLGSHKGSFESEIKNNNGLPISLIEKRINKINDQCGKIVFILDPSTGNVKINNKYEFNEARNIKFVDKFFQHNPEIAYKADNDELVKYIKDDIPLTLPVDVCVNKSGMPKSDYIHFNYNGNIYLYKMNLDTFEFYRLNLLGNKVMTEYSTTRNSSLISSNNIVSVSTESSEEKSVMSWLNEILATPQNKNYALAEYLKPFAKNVDIAYENFNGAMKYRKEDNTIVINPIRVNKLSTGEAQEKLLHELLHACTTKILQENIKGSGKGVTFERGTDGKFTVKIEIAENAPIQIHNLIRVYKDAVVALQDDSPIGKVFKEMLNLYVDKINRGESVNNLTELKKRVLEKYPELKDIVENSTFFSSYYLTNPYEFIAGIFFAPELVSKLNTIPASSKSDMTLIERFARALKKILDAIGNIVAGSEAESVVNDIISIINMSNEESIDVVSETENTENEQENKEATTLDSDVKSVKEFQGEMSDKNPERIKWLLEHPDNRSLEELLDLDAPIIDEHDFSLGDKVTIKGTQYRLLEVGEDSNFKYAVSKVNGMYKISTIQGGVFVTPTYFQHPDFTSLLHDFSKICDTFAKNGIDVFENPYLFENNNKQNYNEENINLNYC